MQRKESKFNRLQKIGIAMAFFSSILFISTPKEVEAANLGGPSHIGTFEGSTTFTTSSSNGVNPGLYLEVMDRYGNYKEYTSEDGVITVDGTKEGSYVTQAKLLGKTKYRDVHTGELLDQWEEGRDLELESSKMPVLKTVGKNLFELPQSDEMLEGVVGKYIKLNLKPNTNYTYNSILDKKGNASEFYFYGWISNDINSNYTGYPIFHWLLNKTFSKTFNTGNDEWYFHIFSDKQLDDYRDYLINFQLEEGTVATTYEPYKTNILTVNEPVELRGIGDIQDTLDLMTGELTQRINEVVLDGSESKWEDLNEKSFVLRGSYFGDSVEITDTTQKIAISNKFNWGEGELPNTFRIYNRSGVLWTMFGKSSNNQTLEEFKAWLQANPLTVQYRLATESVKTVVLTSDYYFQPVMNRDVHIDGTILPLVCSVTIPTEHLSFVLNPNEEKGKQFVAPDFSITNNTPASIYLALNTFEQLSNDLNDVLPTEHENWNTLDRKQSKDIALALVPKPSDGWLSLTEGPRYVADSSNYYLGEVKAESSVDFTFEANHGRAFLETLSPRYRLSFIFDFFDK